MVSAPVIVFLYDRTFVAGSFPGGLAAAPRPLYLGLASTWILLGFLVFSGGGDAQRDDSGFGVGVAWWAYA